MSQPSGHSAFRFLISADTVRSDPATAHFAEKTGELRLLYGADRRIVVYPCRDNKELNFVCLHPSEESEVPQDDDWNSTASKDLVLKIFDSYPEDVKALLRHAPDGVKLWDLLDLPALETVRSLPPLFHPANLSRYHTDSDGFSGRKTTSSS